MARACGFEPTHDKHGVVIIAADAEYCETLADNPKNIAEKLRANIPNE